MRFFITGTDTNIGKTLVSAWLCLHYSASYWKPIQCGTAEGTDRSTVARLSNQPTHSERYLFDAPLAPHFAASAIGASLALDDFVLPTQEALIVEGAGGVFVPLNHKQTIADLISHLALPAVIVARGTLGTINHTLLTLAALKARSIPIIGVVFSGELVSANATAIEEHSGIPILGHLPRLDVVNSESLFRLPPPDLSRHTEKLLLP